MSTTNELNVVLTPAPAGIGRVDDGDDGDDAGPASIETVIKPRLGWIAINWGELAQAHELFYTLVARDLKIRYKQTVLGVAWAVLQPLLSMVVFTVIFGMLLKVPTTVPYALFAYAALVPWMFFANSVTLASMSLLNNQNMLTKIYFPRLYVPGAAVGSGLVDLLIGLSLLAFLMPAYHFTPGWGLLALPLMIALAALATLGVGLALAALTLLYRDLRFVVPFVLQILIFASGVQVPMTGFPPVVQLVAAINPMYGIISGFRSSILGMPWDFGALAVSTLSTAAVLVFGLFFFRRTERLIADIV